MKYKLKIINYKRHKDVKKIKKALLEDGVVILRNFYDINIIEKLIFEWNKYFEKPAVNGVFGYSRTAHYRLSLNPFILGEPAIKILLDLRLIRIIEKCMDGDCILAEADAKKDKATNYNYFPLHSDFSIGWNKSEDIKKGLKKTDLNNVLGIGGILYLHNTSQGAFSYSLGSHKLKSSYGQKLNAYPNSIKDEIKNNVEVCSGIKGDLVLFDDRGFHGPALPSNKNRSVILMDFYNSNILGKKVVAPYQIWSTNISLLNKKQMRVLGCEAVSMVDVNNSIRTRFKRNILYNLMCIIINNAYLFDNLKANIKKFLRL